MSEIFRHLDKFLPTEVVHQIISQVGGLSSLISILKKKYSNYISIPVHFSDSQSIERVPPFWEYIDFHYPTFWNNIQDFYGRKPDVEYYSHGESKINKCNCCPNGPIDPNKFFNELIDISMISFANQNKLAYEAAYIVFAKNSNENAFDDLLKTVGADPVNKSSDLADDIVVFTDNNVEELAADIDNQLFINADEENNEAIRLVALLEIATENVVNLAIVGENRDVTIVDVRISQRNQNYILRQEAEAASRVDSIDQQDASAELFPAIVECYGNYNMDYFTHQDLREKLIINFKITLEVVETNFYETSINFAFNTNLPIFTISFVHPEESKFTKTGDICLTDSGISPSSRIINFLDSSYDELYFSVMIRIHDSLMSSYSSWITVADLDFAVTTMIDLVFLTSQYMRE